MQLAKCAVYARLLVSEVLYSCTNVQDSILTILFKGRRAVGVIRKFVSCCEESCDVCTDATFCYHYMIVNTYTLSPFGIEDNITNAEAAHVMRTEESG